jgi:hypothetical protein
VDVPVVGEPWRSCSSSSKSALIRWTERLMPRTFVRTLAMIRNKVGFAVS